MYVKKIISAYSSIFKRKMVKYKQQKSHQISLLCLTSLVIVISIGSGALQTIWKANGFMWTQYLPTTCLTQFIIQLQKSVLILMVSAICLALTFLLSVGFFVILIVRFCKQLKQLRKQDINRKTNENNGEGEQLLQQTQLQDKFFNLSIWKISIVLILLILVFTFGHFGLTFIIYLAQRLCKVQSNIVGLLIPSALSFCSLLLLIGIVVILILLKKKVQNNEQVQPGEEQKNKTNEVEEGNALEMQDIKKANQQNNKQNSNQLEEEKINHKNKDDVGKQQINYGQQKPVKSYQSVKKTQLNDANICIWKNEDDDKSRDFDIFNTTITEGVTRKKKEKKQQPTRFFRSPIQKYLLEDKKSKVQQTKNGDNRKRSEEQNDGDISREMTKQQKELRKSLCQRKFLEEQKKYISSINGKDKTGKKLLIESDESPKENLHKDLKKRNNFGSNQKDEKSPSYSEQSKYENKKKKKVPLIEKLRSKCNF